MTPLNLPPFQYKLSGTKEHPMIFDILRCKYVALTPEEWVRQHFTHYLIEHIGYPRSMMANEVSMKIGDKKLRADSVVYRKGTLAPAMIIEYKAPSVQLTREVLTQIAVYNTLLKVDYLTITNGITFCVFKLDKESKKYQYQPDIPKYNEL